MPYGTILEASWAIATIWEESTYIEASWAMEQSIEGGRQRARSGRSGEDAKRRHLNALVGGEE